MAEVYSLLWPFYNNVINLEQRIIDKILEGGVVVDGQPSWKADSLIYEKNYGPIKVKVIDRAR